MAGFTVILLSLLMIPLAIISLVCFVIVLIEIFKNGETTLGLVCVILLLCGGVGHFVVLVIGWINAGQWNIRSTIAIWTLSTALQIIISMILVAMFIVQTQAA